MDSRFIGLVLAVIALSSLLLASCAAPPTTSAPSGTEATSAKPYGSLTFGWSSQISGPLLIGGNVFAGLGSAIYDTLINLDTEGQPMPGIAERWEISPDGLTQTFYIRKGVKFHDGSDLTGADVKFSIERILYPDPKVVLSQQLAERSAWTAQIAGIDLKDDYTVAFRLKQAQYELLTSFARPSTGATAVLPKKYFQEKGEEYAAAHPIGSGPWKYVNYQDGLRIDLEAVESHWRTAPKFKNLTVLFVPEESTKVAMLKTGELDIAMVSPDSVAPLKSSGLRILAHQGASQLYVFIWYDLDNPSKYPLGDVRARKALVLGSDRKEVADKIFAGYAQPGVLFGVTRTAYFFDPNVLKPDPYDPAGAKKLLAEAGYPDGFNMKIWDTSGGGVVSQIDQALAGYWKKIGVNAEIVVRDYSAFKPLYTPKVTPEVYNTLWDAVSGGNTWQDETLRSSYHSKRSTTMNIRIPELDKLLDELPFIRDPAEKKKAALEAAVLGNNNYSSPSFFDIDTTFAIGPKVGEFKPIKGASTYMGTVYATISHSK